jgi:hypothetical protein
MRKILSLVLGIVCGSALLSAQTAEELVSKNLDARGGVEKIKAIKSLRMTGRFQQGSFTAQVAEMPRRPTTSAKASLFRA